MTDLLTEAINLLELLTINSSNLMCPRGYSFDACIYYDIEDCDKESYDCWMEYLKERARRPI